MAVLNEILQTQITALQTDIKNISSKIEGILAGCTVRHRQDISAELVKLDLQVKTLEKELHGFEGTINNNAKSVDELKEKLNELTGRVNILVLKFEEHETQVNKIKDNKSNFLMQIAILVIAGLITAIISIAGTLIWSGINSRTTQNYNHTYYKQYNKHYNNNNNSNTDDIKSSYNNK